MLKKVIKIVLIIIAGILLVFLVLSFVLWVNSPGKTAPITDANGENLDSSVSVIEKIMVGGQEQCLIIRGVDKTKPVMLFLHGGPGSPEIPFMRNYNRAIENDFVMVYWEQRGAGKSYSENIPVESMTLSQFISDTKEVSEYLVKRFNQEKIFVMGHSWGSLLGILAAHQHPELFHAYFGVGQVAHQYKGEKISFDWVKEQAKQQHDEEASEELARMNFPDSLATSSEWMQFLMNERNYVTKFGGAIREMRGMWPMIKMVLDTEEYTMGDKVNYMKGNIFSLENLWDDVINTNLFVAIDSMKVPVYIFQGAYDYQTPYAVAEDFYIHLKAPHKELFTFKNSAHSPLMEEVDKFNSIVREKARSTNPRQRNPNTGHQSL